MGPTIDDCLSVFKESGLQAKVIDSSGGKALLFLGAGRYAMIECDTDGDTVALLVDNRLDKDAEAWLIEDLESSAKRIVEFIKDKLCTERSSR